MSSVIMHDIGPRSVGMKYQCMQLWHIDMQMATAWPEHAG